MPLKLYRYSPCKAISCFPLYSPIEYPLKSVPSTTSKLLKGTSPKPKPPYALKAITSLSLLGLKNWLYFNSILLESFVSKQFLECGWNDYVSVTLKDEKYLNIFDDRIIYKYKKFSNGIDHNQKLYNFSNKSEDQKNWGFRLWYRIRKKIDKIKKWTI